MVRRRLVRRAPYSLTDTDNQAKRLSRATVSRLSQATACRLSRRGTGPGAAPDNLTSVSASISRAGTACLWSSPLQADARRSLRYAGPHGWVKPHLLTLVRSSLGAETRVNPPRHFYLQDKARNALDHPLPFRCTSSRVETNDLISGNRFVTLLPTITATSTASTRFRGFGRVEQWDTRSWRPHPSATSPATNLDRPSWYRPRSPRPGFTPAPTSPARISRHLETSITASRSEPARK